MYKNALLTLLFSIFSLALAAQCSQSNGIIFVTTANDEGAGSLRAAIECANQTDGANTIRFNIPSLLDQVIYVGETSGMPLPELTDPKTTIDGSSQGGFGINGDLTPKIILDGSRGDWDMPVNGITISAPSCNIYSLEIRHFSFNGILIRNAIKCIIGDANKGNIIYANGDTTDYYPNASPTGPYEGSGIYLQYANSAVSNCGIYNNLIGTDENYTPGLGNEWAGLRSVNNTLGNLIGFNNEQRRNTFAYNPVGIYLDNTEKSRVSGNLFLCNDTAGIYLANGANNDMPAPVIVEAGTGVVSGTSVNTALVELYLTDTSLCPDAPCQGSTFLGSVDAVDGIWTLTPPYNNGIVLNPGDQVTALAISSLNTSAFSSCIEVSATDGCADSLGNIYVTNTNDDGAGSLRQAIRCANFKEGANRIVFDIPADQLDTIFVGATTNEPLPNLSDTATFIDGASQPGSSPLSAPLIILDGSKADWDIPFNGLSVRNDHCRIHHIQMIRFVDDAIDITNADGVVITNNVLHSNGAAQDTFSGVPINSAPWEGSAIHLKGNHANCTITGNIIGTNFGKTSVLPNEYAGIRLSDNGQMHQIGGEALALQNHIAHNHFGIWMDENIQQVNVIANGFVCNVEGGVVLSSPASNDGIQAPEVTQAFDLSVSGRGVPMHTVQVYAMLTNQCRGENGLCQGNSYIGKAVVDANGDWLLDDFLYPMPAGVSLLVTATATDTLGNTSEFGNCVPYSRSCSQFDLDDVIIDIVPDTCDTGNGSFGLVQDPMDTSTQYYVLDVLLKLSPDSAFSILDSVISEPGGLTIGGITEGDYCIVVADYTGCSDTLEASVGSVGVIARSSFEYHLDSMTALFTNESQNASEYVWLVNDSIVAFTDGLTYTFPQSGVYEVCLVAIGLCNRDTICRELVIIAEDEIPIYDIGEGYYSHLDTGHVMIPVYASRFFDMLGMQFTIELVDVLTASFVGTSDYALPQMSAGNFTISQDQVLVQWSDFSLNGQTVPDSTVLFNLILALEPDAESCTPMVITDQPTTIQSVRSINGNGYEVPTQVRNGNICKVTSIGGEIFRLDSIPVGLVSIYCDSILSDTTDLNGEYACEFTGDSIRITPEKKINPDNGVRTFDLLLIQNHILNLQHLNSPYKLIAADATQDGKINVFDLLVIQNVILRMTPNFPNEKSWRFVDANYVFQTNEPLKEDWPESVLVANNGQIPDQVNFVGVKLGDVNIDNNSITEQNGDTMFISSEIAYSGQTANVKIAAAETHQWRGFQFSVDFDESKYKLTDISAARFVIYNNDIQDAQEVPVLWFHQGIDLDTSSLWAEGERIINLQFQKIGSHNHPLEIKLGDAIMDECVGSDFQAGPVFLDGIGRVTSVSPIPNQEGLSWRSFAPNPVINEAFAELTIGMPSDFQISVFSMDGKLHRHRKWELPTGTHQIPLPHAELLTPGMYVAYLRLGNRTWSETFIVR